MCLVTIITNNSIVVNVDIFLTKVDNFVLNADSFMAKVDNFVLNLISLLKIGKFLLWLRN